MDASELWKRYLDFFCGVPSLGFSLDISRVSFDEDFLPHMEPRIKRAFRDMGELERGALANPDEKRMVGHYWLRTPELAPSSEIRREIEETLSAIKAFAKEVHDGTVRAPKRVKFTDLLVIGIGGSALGPQFVSHALGDPARDRLNVHFFDNSDPDGMDLVLAGIGKALASTLVVVISKSGGTKETRNGQLETRHAFEKAGLAFAKHFVAVTGEDSELDKTAEKEGWLRRFPMWDWVGGRTSELSAVGLLPAALQGIDVDAMLEGARTMDVATRSNVSRENPAALLALMWFYLTEGRGTKDMVVLPYKDRLLLFSRYLQQLVMESLGKELDLKGNVVNQGIAVYGNKGSTDQHAYVQQLREGVLNFFVTFIEVLREREGEAFFVEPGATSGDYLHGFLRGTREALFEKGRESITLTIPDVSPRSVGALIALYERAVGFYGALVGINAYHQPGVEAGKKAAGAVLELQKKVLAELKKKGKGGARTAAEIAEAIGAAEQAELVYQVLRHLAANPGHGVKGDGAHPKDTRFS